MTLFHVIKFPISYPPTDEQLQNLPFEIRYKYQVDKHENNDFKWSNAELHRRLIGHLLRYEEGNEDSTQVEIS